MDLNLNNTPEKSVLEKLKGKVVVIKYGGNAMIDETARDNVLRNIAQLKNWGLVPVVVHGGGPFIKDILQKVGIESEFIDGHRKTDGEAIGYVEMALRGKVNGDLVKQLNHFGCAAVGLSGKDAHSVVAKKRVHRTETDGEIKKADLGHVGDVDSIDTSLIQTLIKHQYTPVLAPIAVGSDLKDYNINADMFAGHLAGALKAEAFIAMTNVDGLMRDIKDSSSVINKISIKALKAEMGDIVQGGMIPKVEACMIAIQEGAAQARIINGLTPNSISKTLVTTQEYGTVIH